MSAPTAPPPSSAISPDAPWANLAPSAVWAHFAQLCKIPRPSKAEGPLRDHLAAWARNRGLAVSVDPAGNLFIAKPARPGRESAPPVMMQGHLDMVCQQTAASHHDFQRDPIVPVREGEWLIAPETTLGADNGLGVALALAALEDETLDHGPLQVVLTVDEEAGMGGAFGLDAEALQGSVLLNLDTEEWGHFYLGCAGGADVNVSGYPDRESPPPDALWRTLRVAGLVGGHSGIDIHRGRGQAIRLLLETLTALFRAIGQTPGKLALAALKGGTARNALAREAEALVAISPAAEAAAQAWLAATGQSLMARFADTDPQLTLTWETAPAPDDPAVLTASALEQLLPALAHSPYGVAAWSQDFPGVVETSNNLGVLHLPPGQGGALSANFMVRSLKDGGTRALCQQIAEPLAAVGLTTRIEGHYPGWTPNPASPLLALCRQVYQRQFGTEAQLEVVHAGLECGILAAKAPRLDMISFGPTIRGAHAPGERAHIPAVAQTWTLLREILAAVARGELATGAA